MTITDPASAAAAARCLAARVRDAQRWLTTEHPSRCGWCDYPTDVLAPMIDGFWQRAGFDQRQHTDLSGVVGFESLPRDAQRARITAAQQLEDEPPPAPGRAETSPPPASRPLEASPVPLPDEQTPATPPRPSWAGGPS